MNLALSLSSAGFPSEAAAEYTIALSLRPSSEAHYGLGCALLDAGDLPAALRSFEAAASLDPHDVDARVHLGNARRDAGDLPGALREYRIACRVKVPTSGRDGVVTAHYNLGSTCLEVGGAMNLEEAIAAFKVAIKLDPEHADAHYNCGIAYHERGQFEAALKCYENAVNIDRDFEDAVNARDNARLVVEKQREKRRTDDTERKKVIDKENAGVNGGPNKAKTTATYKAGAEKKKGGGSLASKDELNKLATGGYEGMGGTRKFGNATDQNAGKK